MRTIFSLECTVLVPSDSTTVTVDWYWSKNISECGRNITEEQGRFDIYTSRGYAQLNTDRITTDLNIGSLQNDSGYYWCQVNDFSYNGVFISSNKAPVFDTRTMTTCSERQFVNLTTCASISNINTLSPLICFISTQTVSPTMYNSILTTGYNQTALSINGIKSISSTVTTTVTTVSGNTTVTDQDSTSANMYPTLITPSILLTTVMKSTNSTITSIVSTAVYDGVPFTTNNITLIISVSLVILLIISMLSCGVIVVIVIIKRRKTYKTNNGK